MNRSPQSMRWILATILSALVAAVVVTVASPTNAQAQVTSGPSIALTVSPSAADQSFRTLAVSLDSGTVGLAALGVTLQYNPDQVVVSSCAVSEAGACNVDQGRVLASVFNLNRLGDNDQLLTVSFESTGASASTSFGLVVDTAASLQGLPLPEILVQPIEVDLAAQFYGSLTGVVVAEQSETALYNIDVCVMNDDTQAQQCTTSTGLGTWRLDDLAIGGYTVVAADATGVYTSSSAIASVVTDQVMTAPDMVLGFATGDEPNETDDVADDLPAVVPAAQPTAEVIVYEASIAGRITAVDTRAPLEAIQVCATQPLVLHQSCATTDADGIFSLADLSTGNYWITVVDPLAQYQEARPKLVGVVGDRVARSGVEIRLAPISG